MHRTLPKEEGDSTKVQATTWSPHRLKQVSKPSYMAIKKALCGKQPGLFSFGFYFCTLAGEREFCFGFLSGVFNKVQSWTHLDVLKLTKHMEQKISVQTLFSKKILWFFSVTPIALIFIL